jgi:hypothetical protein
MVTAKEEKIPAQSSVNQIVAVPACVHRMLAVIASSYSIIPLPLKLQYGHPSKTILNRPTLTLY